MFFTFQPLLDPKSITSSSLHMRSKGKSRAREMKLCLGLYCALDIMMHWSKSRAPREFKLYIYIYLCSVRARNCATCFFLLHFVCGYCVMCVRAWAIIRRIHTASGKFWALSDVDTTGGRGGSRYFGPLPLRKRGRVQPENNQPVIRSPNNIL